MDLVHCAYCSASSNALPGSNGLETLLEERRQKNVKADITGMLLYQDGAFFQVLEGDRAVVEALLKRIAADKRHERVTRIILESITERAFAAWSMGYPNVSWAELAEIPGLNDFFIGGKKSFLHLGEGRAKTLLSAFKEGKWRASLS
jgi:Sensors of blue-light using FAD